MILTRCTVTACTLGVLLAIASAPGCDVDPTEERVDLAWSYPADGYAPGALLSVAAPAPDDVWVVGGEANRAVALHWDGAAWTAEDTGLTDPLWWVHAFDDGTVFVVGDQGAIARRAPGQTAWETLDAGVAGTTLYGLWGTSPTDVWAVGGPSPNAASEAREGDIVLHYDGAAWTRVTIEALVDKPASAGKNLFKVWGAAADRVFIVGDSGMALHYDGVAWTRQATDLGTTALTTVWGRSASDVYAVGGGGAPALIHWDGATWSDVALPPSAPQVIQGVWTAPGHALYISGWQGFTARMDRGGLWSAPDPDTPNALHAIAGDADGALWAVGGNIYAFQPDYEGTLATTRTDVPSP